MDITPRSTLVAYRQVSEELGFLTNIVHTYVLESGFIQTHQKKLVKSIKKVSDRYDEMLLDEFIGRLRFKLPQLRMGIKLNDHEKERARLIAAGVIAHLLIDNDVFDLDLRMETQVIHGHKKFFTRQYLKLGGSFEKDIKAGIEDGPGVVRQHSIDSWKLNADEKAFLRTVGAVPFVVSEICTRELLLKGYSLKKDWNVKKDKNGRALSEDPIMKKKRIRNGGDIIIDELKPKKAFYLPAKYCGRDRVYYEAARLEGIRPHGKLWETLMLDSAVPYEVGPEGERVLKHIIYVLLHGKVSIEEANEKITMEDILDASSIDPLEQETEKSFGEAILLNKAYQALMDSVAGKPSRFMFGYDFTNSGLLMSGVSFRSEKMMQAANMAGGKKVVDSHTAFGAAYDLGTEDHHVYLERDDVKKIHMGLMHGSMLESIAGTISELTQQDVSVEKVKSLNEKAYGKPVHNITRIADWGTKVIGNEQSTLRWTLPDGFHAASKAYFKGVPVLIYCASAKHKEGYTRHVVISDMPWMEDSSGFAVYGKDTYVGGKAYPVQQKRRGLFANITHSIDAYMLRQITRAVVAAGYPIMLKHDDFIVPPAAVGVVREAAKDVFYELFESNLYQKALDEIVEYSPYYPPRLECVLGDAANTVEESENFLMP